LEEASETAKRLMAGLLERMGAASEVEVTLQEGNIHIDIRSNNEGFLIGKNGRTLDSLEMLMNRMINKQLKEPARTVLDIGGYRKRREESLSQIALETGEKAKRMGRTLTIGPFNAHERRIIHLTLKENSSVETESIGEGDIKKVSIIPKRGKGEVSSVSR
jgi:spoIIIJ-associated protein